MSSTDSPPRDVITLPAISGCPEIRYDVVESDKKPYRLAHKVHYTFFGDGRTIDEDWRWDGATMVPDIETTIRASLFHDHSYALIKREKRRGMSIRNVYIARKEADERYRNMVGGVWGEISYVGLRCFGWTHV